MKNNERLSRGEKKLRRKKITAGIIAFSLVGIMILGALAPLLASL